MSILQLPIFQFSDANGLLVGAKLYSYAGGSTVPKALYHDNLLTSKASNPVIADALGIFPELFMGSGAYRLQMYDRFDNLIATRDWVSSEGSGGGDTTANGPVESVSLESCSTFRHLGGDLNAPRAIGAYFFAKDEIDISAISVVIPFMESQAAGDIQFAIYKPQYSLVGGNAVPMVGISANTQMTKVASGFISPANAANIYASGILVDSVKVQGWYCVVLTNTPASSWPSIYASANFAEMCSILTPSQAQYQVPLQFVRDDIVNPNEQIPSMWPETINSLWGSSAHLISKTIVPYIRVEIA